MNEIKFIKSIYSTADIPKDSLGELIICGRSNVGKSSFINTVLNRKSIAKVSSTPGKTRSINYYLINDKFYLVDLPGYGYAKVKDREQDFWEKLLGNFIVQNKKIKAALHLIDCRHEPTKLDRILQDFLLQTSVPSVIVLTKVDKLTKNELHVLKLKCSKIFPEHTLNKDLFFFSSLSKYGVKEIKAVIMNMF